MLWQDKQAELLRAEIEICLRHVPDAGGLRGLVREPLARPRRGLTAEGGRGVPFPLLPLIVCESVSGRYVRALPASAALQFLMAACDVFDDVEDADSSDSLAARHGQAVATLVATALLFLGEKAALRLNETGVGFETALRVMDALNSFYLAACAGQHLDLCLTSEAPVSEEEYLQIISMKSAAQIECACRVGALLGGANPELTGMFGAFGRSLGMAAQITNDIQGIMDGRDIVNRMITLPVVYAFAQTKGEAYSRLKLAFCRQRKTSGDPDQIKELMFRAGAVHYATVKMEFYKQQALDTLTDAQRAGANIERVRTFLD